MSSECLGTHGGVSLVESSTSGRLLRAGGLVHLGPALAGAGSSTLLGPEESGAGSHVVGDGVWCFWSSFVQGPRVCGVRGLVGLLFEICIVDASIWRCSCAGYLYVYVCVYVYGCRCVGVV